MEAISPTRHPLSCPVCWTAKSCKYFICKNGHNVCEECKSEMRICPECRGGYNEPPTRNLAFEKMLETFQPLSAPKRKMPFQCKYRQAGCPCAYTTPERMSQHEENCEYKEIKCPRGCNQMITLPEQQDHEAFYHKACGVNTRCTFNGTKEQLEEHEPKCDYKLLVCEIPECKQQIFLKNLKEHMKEWHARCKHAGCRVRTRASKLREHQETCPYRKVKCDKCTIVNLEVREKDLQEHIENCHQPCAYAPMCTRNGRKEDMDEHKLTCRHKPFSCPAGMCLQCSESGKDFCVHGGCSDQVTRTGIASHLRSKHPYITPENPTTDNTFTVEFPCIGKQSFSGISWPAHELRWKEDRVLCQCRVHSLNRQCYLWLSVCKSSSSKNTPLGTAIVKIQGPQSSDSIQYNCSILGTNMNFYEVVQSGKIAGLPESFTHCLKEDSHFRADITLL